jgi:hypothetical protein
VICLRRKLEKKSLFREVRNRGQNLEKNYDYTKHKNLMDEFKAPVDEHFKAPTLIPYYVYFVNVCSFTFEFHSIEEIETCLEYYSKKIHPSSRVHIDGGDSWEFQRWFEKLPMYLLEEPKRQKVVKALKEALVNDKNE